MSALVRKEIRLILPSWIVAMLLAIVPVWVFWGPGPAMMPPLPGALVYAPFALGLVVLAITPFGQEFNLGTFSALVAQPISRNRVWLTKGMILASALFIAYLTLCLSQYLRLNSVLPVGHTVYRVLDENRSLTVITRLAEETRHAVLHETMVTGAIWTFAAVAGGLWTTVLFQQVTASFWFTLLTPLIVLLPLGKIFANVSPNTAGFGGLIVFAVYAGAALIWARSYFLAGRDVQWPAGMVSIGLGRASRTGVSGPKSRGSLRALIGNEFKLHQISLLVAMGLLVLHLGVVGYRWLHPDLPRTHNSLAMILEAWWLLWLALPLLVGAAAVAEERKLGTWESLLCLPTRRRTQFAVKLIIALALGVLLGGVMPVLIEGFGRWLGLPTEVLVRFATMTGPTALGTPIVTSAVLALIAFYASTLMRNTLQTLGTAVLMSVLALFLIVAALNPPRLFGLPLWGRLLVSRVGPAVMIPALLLLAYRNYKRLVEPRRMWLWNGLTLFGASLFVVVSTTSVYNRIWETWLPSEPPHRDSYVNTEPAGMEELPNIQASSLRTAVWLPQGRLWLQQPSEIKVRIVVLKSENNDPQTAIYYVPKGSIHEGFVPGGPWHDVAVSDVCAFGVKSDGTLWDLRNWRPEKTLEASGARQIGTENSWDKIAVSSGRTIGLKKDGTLWQWETIVTVSNGIPGSPSLPEPQQAGNDHDWVAIVNMSGAVVAAKEDGSFWLWGNTRRRTNGVWSVVALATPEPWLSIPEKRRPVSVSARFDSVTAICSDGTFWLGGRNTLWFQHRLATNNLWEPISTTKMFRMDDRTDWRQVTLLNGVVFAIDRGGTFWEWNPYGVAHTSAKELVYYGKTVREQWSRDKTLPTTPSSFSDWIAVGGSENDILTLARDGTLCRWNSFRLFERELRDDPAYYGRSHWLAASRLKATKVATLK